MTLKNRVRYVTQNYLPRALLKTVMHRRYYRVDNDLQGDMEQRFGQIFSERLWGDHVSASGLGSTPEFSERIRAVLPSLIKQLNVRTFLDVPCGDFDWMRTVDLGCHYIGGDIVQAIVDQNQAKYGSPTREFRKIDIVNDALPQAELLMIRDCFIHLPFDMIHQAIANIRRSPIKYLLTTHYPYKRHNFDIPIGKFREVNLRRHPFALPAPERMIREDVIPDRPDHERHLGLWRVESLPG